VRFQGAHGAKDMILAGVRWSVAYPLSARHGEDLREARGVSVDQATSQRGGVKDRPPLAAACPRCQRPGWVSGRMEETDSKSTGAWSALSRAVDKPGQPIDCLVTAPRDAPAANRLLPQAIRRHGVPAQRTSDGRAAKEAAIKSDTEAHGTAIAIRTITSLNPMVDQAPRAVTRGTRPLRGGTAFDAAQGPLVGIARMQRITKTQRRVEAGAEGLTAAEQFDGLAASSPHRPGQVPSHRLHTKFCDRAVMPHGGTTKHEKGLALSPSQSIECSPVGWLRGRAGLVL
jgi:putative transposase